MSDVVVYGFPQSTYVRTARMCLDEKGVPYELEAVDMKTDAYLELHPFRKVPAFRHGDFRLYETLAIARYVDMAFDGPPLSPVSPEGVARGMQWISTINAYLYPVMIQRCIIERFAPKVLGRDPDEATISEALPMIEYQLGVVDEGLADRAMLAGDTATIADYFLAPILFYVAMSPDTAPLVAARPNVVRWHDAMKARPSYRNTVPELA